MEIGDKTGALHALFVQPITNIFVFGIGTIFGPNFGPQVLAVAPNFGVDLVVLPALSALQDRASFAEIPDGNRRQNGGVACAFRSAYH